MRDEFRAPIICGSATAQLDWKCLSQQSGFIEKSGSARALVDLLQEHEVRLFRPHELGDFLKSGSDGAGGKYRVCAGVMEEVVIYAPAALHLVNNTPYRSDARLRR